VSVYRKLTVSQGVITRWSITLVGAIQAPLGSPDGLKLAFGQMWRSLDGAGGVSLQQQKQKRMQSAIIMKHFSAEVYRARRHC
jgi:hypothetical protein